MAKESFTKLPLEKQEAILRIGIQAFSRKSYKETSTDDITKACKISKGLLFHYFGSKKEFYCDCLIVALQRLLKKEEDMRVEGDFYDNLFSVMDSKIRVCKKWPEETLFVNMASRETATEVAEEKNSIIASFTIEANKESLVTMQTAFSKLHLKKAGDAKILEAITLYTKTLINKYLLQYREKPDDFFRASEAIKQEMREYIDFMLYGIVDCE